MTESPKDHLSDLITRVLNIKQGDRDFALFHYAGNNTVDGPWRAEIGNTFPYVSLGEAPAEFSAQGTTPEDAVRALIVEVERSQGIEP
jgi:hypothetical protein